MFTPQPDQPSNDGQYSYMMGLQGQKPAFCGKVLFLALLLLLTELFHLLAGRLQSALVSGIYLGGVHVEVRRVHLVLFDLAAEVLKHTDQVQHEAIPSYQPFIGLQLLPLAVPGESCGHPVQTERPRTFTGQGQVE